MRVIKMRVNRFYNNAIDNQELLPPVAEYGVTNEKLIAGKELVKKVEYGLKHRSFLLISKNNSCSKKR